MSQLRLASLLQIRPGEERLVGLLITLLLLPSAGGAIGSPGVEALFFARFGVDYLPYMYIALGAATLVITLIMTALLGRVSKKRLYLALPLVLVLFLVGARILVAFDLNWFYPLLWLGMYISWTLQALLVWGLAGLLFDTRQAKRLFPLLGAGGILGIALGGLLTRPLVQWLGAANLLLVWAATLLVTLGLVHLLTRTVTDKRRPSWRRARLIDDLQQGYYFVRGSTLMRWLALAVALFSVLFFALAFPFSKAVAAHYPNEDTLAGFLGIFQGAVTTTALLASLFLANRLYARYGFMGALLTLPAIYLISFTILAINAAFLALVLFRFLQMFWLQGITNTAYQALFNIVPAERREQTRVFIDGVPGQAGIAFIGLLLVISQQTLQPRHMFLIGIAVALLTLLVVWQARRAYNQALVEALRAGQPQLFFAEEEPFGGFRRDAVAVAAAVAGISDPDPAVRRVSAEILGNLAVPEATRALVSALEDPDAQTRAALLRSLGHANAATALLEVTACLDDPAPEVRLQAVQALRRLAGYPKGLTIYLKPLLGDPEPAVRATVALALLCLGPHAAALAVLRDMAQAEEAEMRLRALEALAAWGDPVGYDLAAAALDDRHPAVRRSAAVALAQIDPHHCLEPLVQALGDEDHSVRQAVARVIGRIGEPALAIVVASLPNSALEAGALLALEHLPSYHAAATLRQYAQEKVTQALHYNELWRGIGLSTDGNDRLHLLADSLKVTARSHGTYALRAVGLLNDPQAIALAIKNLASKDPQQRANALEMLDSLSDRDLIRPLLRLWEITIPAAGMSPSSDDTTPTWLLAILRDPDPWLRACAALVACKVYHPQVQAQLVQLAHADPEALVCETAALGLPLKGDAPMNTLPTLSLMERILFLRRVPLFAGLPPAELKQVAMIAAEHYFVANEMIAHQGDIGDEMYIIVSGEVHVIVETDETTRVELARRKPGEYVGEMAIISDEPRMASLIALGDVRALCINQKQFEGILRERPETCLAVMRVLCARLKERAPLTTASLAGSAKG